MANPSKQKGTAAETAVVKYLISEGWPYCERRTLSGTHDKGDIAGIAGLCVEVKNVKAITLSAFLKEAETEKKNAKANVGVAWIKKSGTTNPADWYVLMSGSQFTYLLKEAGFQ